jgi:hypothetical protein
MTNLQSPSSARDGRPPDDANESGVVMVPAVTTHSIVGFITVLKERGRWDEVRADVLAHDPFANHWVDRVADGTWCPLDRSARLLASAHRVLGDEGVRSIGVARFSRAMDTGVLAPMLRSWARTVGPDTMTIVKLTPHLWRAGSQSLGELKVLEVRPGHARLHFTTDHPVFLACRAWHVFLEGFALAFIGLSRSTNEGPAPGDVATMTIVDGRVELVLSFS